MEQWSSGASVSRPEASLAHTIEKPKGMFRSPAARRAAAPAWDPEGITPTRRGESLPLFSAGVVLGFFALLVCYRRGYLLLYGDAVAHLAIARRILDAKWPGLAQLGGVWLPLPHLLMLPFVQNMAAWQSGLGGAPMSIVSFAASVAGVWRLTRRLMRPRWALVATAFFALNANLLFLATTAMTETLFLALLVWSVVVTIEGVPALRAGNARIANARLVQAGLLVLGQVFTRYDGWIVGAAVWCCFAWGFWKASAATRRVTRAAFVAFTLMCVVGPLLWFWYNAHFEGDWLDFMRGHYSAAQIERRTAPPGQHYRGWHNMGWALLFYTRTAQVDAAFSETGFGLIAVAFLGIWQQVRSVARSGEGQFGSEDPAPLCLPGSKLALLLWLPLPFYVYSVAYGSVPIFIPQLWPHSYYNARYGMELLPALAVYAALAGNSLDGRLRRGKSAGQKIGARLLQPVAMLLCVANCIAMMYSIPLVLKEGIVNATTRVPFEHALSVYLAQVPADQPVMMAVSAHVGAVQVAGRTLKSMVSENDQQTWDLALADPAHHAAYVIAMAGDPVEAAVRAHPNGLEELAVTCTTGQPCARIYRSTVWTATP